MITIYFQISKLLWAILLVVGSSLTFYSMYNVICDYLAFDISTRVTHETVSSLEFPAVTVCNHNRYVVSLLSDVLGPEIKLYAQFHEFCSEYC